MTMEHPALIAHGIGTVAVQWRDAAGEHTLYLEGEAADDAAEQYRAAPDAQARRQFLTRLIRERALP